MKFQPTIKAKKNAYKLYVTNIKYVVNVIIPNYMS